VGSIVTRRTQVHGHAHGGGVLRRQLERVDLGAHLGARRLERLVGDAVDRDMPRVLAEAWGARHPGRLSEWAPTPVRLRLDRRSDSSARGRTLGDRGHVLLDGVRGLVAEPATLGSDRQWGEANASAAGALCSVC
jgi:hypothetical protein